MPVEIRELVIRAVATAAAEETGASGAAPAAEESLGNRESIIQECVRQVVRILQKTKER